LAEHENAPPWSRLESAHGVTDCAENAASSSRASADEEERTILDVGRVRPASKRALGLRRSRVCLRDEGGECKLSR
jgi:hypothetical protein